MGREDVRKGGGCGGSIENNTGRMDGLLKGKGGRGRGRQIIVWIIMGYMGMDG